MTQNPGPQYAPPQYPAAPKKKNRKMIVLVAAAIVVAICCGGSILAVATSNSGKTGNGGAQAATSQGVQAAVATSAAAVATTKAAPQPSPTPPPAPKVLLSLNGSGIKKTALFNTGAEWTLSYSYDCSGFSDGTGNFAVYEYTNSSPNDVMVNELDKGGKDSVPAHDDPGTHYLEVNSECKWSITVTG